MSLISFLPHTDNNLDINISETSVVFSRSGYPGNRFGEFDDFSGENLLEKS